MKTIMRVGFWMWRKTHNKGCRRIVDSTKHRIRRKIAFHLAMMVRALLIAMESA